MNKKILIIEDDSIVAIDIKNQLEALGYECCGIADTGEAAMDLIIKQQPDLILMDIVLKGDIDGIQIAEFIRKNYNIPVIFLTADSDKSALERAKVTEPYGYILKPFHEDELHTTVEIALYKHEAEQKIYRLALYDNLTGLPNYEHTMKKLKRAFNLVHDDKMLALLLLDIDRLKNVNDTLGHDIGDLLLKEFANRLEKFTDANTFVARRSGDQFMVVATNLNAIEEIEKLANEILEKMIKPFNVKDYLINVTVSIGIAVTPLHTDSLEKLVVYADEAMYDAKRRGGNMYEIFVEELHERYAERYMIEESLRNALSNNELKLFYQPRLDLHTKKLLGLEALLRWESDELGTVSPVQLIEIAEDCGLLNSIGDWILTNVFEQTKYLQGKDSSYNIRISINIADSEFNDRLVNKIKYLAKKYNYNPAMLEIEVTEEIIYKKARDAFSILTELKKLGVGITIDNAGTGPIVLSNLKNMQIDAIKIDSSLIKSMVFNETDRLIIKSFIDIAHNLGICVIAKGVENEAQIAILRTLHCDQIQGYLVSYPVPNEIMNMVIA